MFVLAVSEKRDLKAGILSTFDDCNNGPNKFLSAMTSFIGTDSAYYGTVPAFRRVCFVGPATEGGGSRLESWPTGRAAWVARSRNAAASRPPVWFGRSWLS
jgi:hypothetical protein